MKEADKKILNSAKKRLKRQNAYIKTNYDRVSIVMQKGRKAAIEKTGESLNGFINAAIERELKRRGLLDNNQDNGSPEK